MKKILKIVLLGGLLVLFGWTLFFLFEKSKEAPVVYKTEAPFIADIVHKTVATGSVVPRKEILIKPQVSGIIQKIYVEAGDIIKEGDLIAKIKVIPDMIALNNAENRLNLAKINAENTAVDFERSQKLYRDQVIAEVNFQEAERARKAALEELIAAENNLMLVREGVAKKPGQPTNTLIRSTIAGMVLDVPVEQGNSVIESNNFNEGTTVATVADMNDLVFEGKVDESEVGKIKEGMDLILTIGAIESQRFNAKLEYISPKGVLENGAIQFEIRAAVNLQEDQFVRAGYSANADVVLAKRSNVLALQESLLQFKGDSAFVEVEVAPQEFETRALELGISDGIKVEVLNGISREDKIKVWNRAEK